MELQQPLMPLDVIASNFEYCCCPVKLCCDIFYATESDVNTHKCM